MEKMLHNSVRIYFTLDLLRDN